jgi:hypothetical protein
MAHADMAKGIEDAFICEHAIGKSDLVAGLGKTVGQGLYLALKQCLSGEAAKAKLKWRCLPR